MLDEGAYSSSDEDDSLLPAASLALLKSSEETKERAKARKTIAGYRRKLLELDRFMKAKRFAQQDLLNVRMHLARRAFDAYLSVPKNAHFSLLSVISSLQDEEKLAYVPKAKHLAAFWEHKRKDNPKIKAGTLSGYRSALTFYANEKCSAEVRG